MTTPKAWIQLASNTACKMTMRALGSMLAETDAELAANIRGMRSDLLCALDSLASAAAAIENAREEAP
jgi:hypothetical protein